MCENESRSGESQKVTRPEQDKVFCKMFHGNLILSDSDKVYLTY